MGKVDDNWICITTWVGTMTLTVSFWNFRCCNCWCCGWLGLMIGYHAGKAIADSFGPVITVVLGLALAFGAMWAAATMGGSVVTTLAGWAALTAGMGGVGIAIAGVGSAFKPAR